MYSKGSNTTNSSACSSRTTRLTTLCMERRHLQSTHYPLLLITLSAFSLLHCSSLNQCGHTLYLSVCVDCVWVLSRCQNKHLPSSHQPQRAVGRVQVVCVCPCQKRYSKISPSLHGRGKCFFFSLCVTTITVTLNRLAVASLFPLLHKSI